MKPESKSSITSDIVSLLTFSGSPPLQLLYQVKVLFLGMIKARESAYQLYHYLLQSAGRRDTAFHGIFFQYFFTNLLKVNIYIILHGHKSLYCSKTGICQRFSLLYEYFDRDLLINPGNLVLMIYTPFCIRKRHHN